jgi:C4-type Zn-finger protein
MSSSMCLLQRDGRGHHRIIAGMGKCPRCNGRLFTESAYVPNLGMKKETYCLQCGYRENRPYEGVILAKKHPAKHERGYSRKR